MTPEESFNQQGIKDQIASCMILSGLLSQFTEVHSESFKGVMYDTT